MEKSKQTRKNHAPGYSYPNTNILKNKYGLTDPNAFGRRYEHDVLSALDELSQEPVPARVGSEYLMHIHKRLFRDVYEWAGKPRYMHFKFRDGSVAVLDEMEPTESGISYANSEEIRRELASIDYDLSRDNCFRGLSREDFINRAAKILVSLEKMHLFVDGNKLTNQLFLEKLAEIAGHNFDFSLVTETHMNVVAAAALKYNDLQPLKEMLDGISDPTRTPALEEFVRSMQHAHGSDFHNNLILAAKEGKTYEGIYQGVGVESFAIRTGDTYVVCQSSHLAPEQLKNMQSGDKILFTVPKAEDLEKILIPAEKVADLTKEQIAEQVSRSTFVKAARGCVEYFSERVYGKSGVFDTTMGLICGVPGAGSNLPALIESDPRSFHKLAGFNFFGFKTNRRLEAEENVGKLSDALKNYTLAARDAKKELLENHKKDQERRGQEVRMPSKSLLDVLDLPREHQQKALEQSPELRKELDGFVKQVENRLSPKDRRAIGVEGARGELMSSIGVSANKAKEISRIFSKAKEALKEEPKIAKVIKLQQKPKAVSIAS
ncbi:BID domain-containing T4SS effector [Bartonella sp. CB178]|uniref:BID domain-containing T4SS effector n=1 Tax=Bartonella sp. CB178 TaxID=3112255 RepID=UPI00300E04D3